jgi:phosphoglycolate phosphatase-like HAD superfamily hydrolase
MHICFLDIDGTLVLTGGAGKTAFARTLAEDFGIAKVDGDVPFAGRSDRAIAMDLFRSHGIAPTFENWQRFCTGFIPRLEEALATHQGYILPGVSNLLGALTARGDVALGLLTGNLRQGAHRKLAYYGLWDYFPFGGFGDEHLERCDIAAAALAAARVHIDGQNCRGLAGHHRRDGRAESSEQNVPVPLFLDGATNANGTGNSIDRVIVIGDTPHDIDCGRSIGARCVAVPTGSTSAAVLRARAPDAFVETLEDIEPILGLLDD